MMARRLFRSFIAARTTVVLLCLLALLLLLNVLLPQERVVGEKVFAAMVDSSPLARFFLADLGLGNLSTSPVFLAVLGLFFLNLLAVLATRVGPTLRRISPRPRSEQGLQAWARLEEHLTDALPRKWSAGHVATTLRGFGYRVHRPGERTFWGVRHRSAPLGFLLFHVSFILLLAGGVLIYYTRFVGSAILSEGQEFSGSYSEIERAPPLGAPADLRFTLERADVRFERGEPVHLSAVLRFGQGGTGVERRSRVNHPAQWGAARLLVGQVGLAPVLWLQDDRGYTLDRIVAPVRTSGRAPTNLVLGDEVTSVLIHPLREGAHFSTREELLRTALPFDVMDQGRVVFHGELRPGDAAELEGRRLVLEENRLWVRVRVIRERGPGLLIAGFIVGIVGLAWRLLMYRREVALTWDERQYQLVGRAEYFSWRFKEELEAIRSTLSQPEDETQQPRRTESTHESR